MIILTESPSCNSDLAQFYARLPHEGLVFSSRMNGECYDPASTYDDDWSCPAVVWSSGGHETYLFENGDSIELRIAGAMTITSGARYGYRAGSTSFQSNMVVFPRSVTELDHFRDVTLETRLIRSDRKIEALLRSISQSCRAQSKEERWYHDRLVELYGHLTHTQKEIDNAAQMVAARKPATQKSIAARVDRAQQFILREFHDPELSVARIAGVACLSAFHLIRVFKSVVGSTPIQYLQATRMTAALRLLRESELSVADIAICVGYSDRTAFVRSFRRRHGAPPSHIRANAR